MKALKALKAMSKPENCESAGGKMSCRGALRATHAWRVLTRLAALLLALCAGSTLAEKPETGLAPEAAGALEAFIDHEMREQMEALGVAGATMALIRDGELVYARGFGLADRGTGEQVDADRTLFRWGSISKTFTWTAIMQLVEQGRVSLDADVNTYLQDFSIPPAFDGPVRVRHLLAHSAGFEDGGIGYLFEQDPGQVISLDEYLKRYLPRRVRPAGTVFAYSNYGTALAGHIVATVSGLSFEEYIQANIFRPLGMRDSTFLEPLPEDAGPAMASALRERVSKGFVADEAGARQIEEFTFMTQVAPAGSLSSTVVDMARFAQAHLRDCELDAARILGHDTCTQMHSVLVPLNAGGRSNVQYGFIQDYAVLGHDRFWHNGGTRFFRSQMSLYPDLDFAFLLSANTDSGSQLYQYMEKAIVEKLFGDRSPMLETLVPAAESSGRARQYEGHYVSTRRNYSSIESVFSLFQGAVKVSLDTDGYLIITADGEPVRAVEVGPGLFRAADKDTYFEFVADDTGEITYLKTVGSFDKVDWYQAPRNRLLLLGCTLAVLVVGLIALARRSMQRFSGRDTPLVRVARRWMLASVSTWCIFLLTLSAGLYLHIAAHDLVTSFPSLLVVIALLIGTVAFLLSLLPLWFAVRLWRAGAWSTLGRYCYSLLVLALWLLIAQLQTLHLIGFSFSG
jgi:CubicO group peptidase (beta-lactamase class C family)